MERELLADVLRLMDEGVLVDRSEKPLRPVITIVGSGQIKRLAETEDEYEDRMRVVDVGRFVRELKHKYPFAELVLSNKSAAERAAMEMAELLEMPCRVIEPGEKGEWDAGAAILDERCVGASTHVVAFDQTARSKEYKRLAQHQYKVFSQI